MDKKEYIANQLRRTFNKKYENYCITRIYHLLNRLDMKIVTQQLFRRDNGKIALADLYLPQINLIIEIDEGHHLDNKENDEKRTEEIIKNKITMFEEVVYYDLQIERIDVTRSIEYINQRVNEIIVLINEKINNLKEKFIPWKEEYNSPERYIKLGYIDAKDEVKFRTVQEVSELFNKGYKGIQRVWFSDKDGSNVRVWCPKLKLNGYDYGVRYSNEMTLDGEIIYEFFPEDNSRFIDEATIGTHKNLTIRYTFAKFKDSSGEDMYRFRGVFELDKEATIKEKKRVWRKIDDRIELKKYFEI
jgi:very-short-patch-repair endonuclease